MQINSQNAVQRQRPNAANRTMGRKAQNPAAAKRTQVNRSVQNTANVQGRRATQRPASARQPAKNMGADPRVLSRTAMNRKNAIESRTNAQPQKAGSNNKAFEAYQGKLTDIIKKRDKNGDMKLSLAETGTPKEAFNKIDVNRDGFINKAELEAKISSRINAMEEILLADPGKLVKMMKELGPEISDKVGGKDSYKKIVKNLKILEANDRAKTPGTAKTKGNVNFIA